MLFGYEDMKYIKHLKSISDNTYQFIEDGFVTKEEIVIIN